MYHEVITQCVRSLRNFEALLDKAALHVAAGKCTEAALTDGRLAPDMQPLPYQVTSACDYVKAASGWLSGQAPPKHADTERTLDEMRARIAKTVAFAESVKKEHYAGAGERLVRLPWAPGKVIGGEAYLLELIIPNTYFHIAMGYAILRHKGVDLGKMDYLGHVSFVAADPSSA